MSRHGSKAPTTKEPHLDDGPLTARSARSESDIPEPRRKNTTDLVNKNPNDEQSSSSDTIPPNNLNLPIDQAVVEKLPVKTTGKAAPQQEHQRELQQEAQEEPPSELQELDQKQRLRKQSKPSKSTESRPKKKKVREREVQPEEKDTFDTKRKEKGPKDSQPLPASLRDNGHSMRNKDSQDGELVDSAGNAAVASSKGKGKTKIKVASRAHGDDRYSDTVTEPEGNNAKAQVAPASIAEADPSLGRLAYTALSTPQPGTQYHPQEVSSGAQDNCDGRYDLVEETENGEGDNPSAGAYADGIIATTDENDEAQAQQPTPDPVPANAESQPTYSACETDVENMLHDIISQACEPREWLQFIGRKDYKIADGRLDLQHSGHRDIASLLHAIFHKINDTADRKYSPTRINHRNIHLQLNTADDSPAIASPDIFKAYSGLSDLLRNSDMSFVELAKEVKFLCQDIAENAKYLFLRFDEVRGFPTKPDLEWSFVVLLAITVLSQPELYDALPEPRANKEMQYLTYQDQISDLLKYLRHNSDKYRHWSTAKITRVWECLQEMLQKEYQTAVDYPVHGNNNPGPADDSAGARRVPRENVLNADALLAKRAAKRTAPLLVAQNGKKMRKV